MPDTNYDNLINSQNTGEWIVGLENLISANKALETYGFNVNDFFVKCIEILNLDIPEEFRNKLYDFFAFFKDEFVVNIVQSTKEFSSEIRQTSMQLLCWVITLYTEGPELLMAQRKTSPLYRGVEDRRIEARIIAFRSVALSILRPGRIYKLDEEGDHNQYYQYVQHLMTNLSYERQEVVSEFISYELEPQDFETLREYVDDVKFQSAILYLGLLEIARMLNPILTIQLLDFFTHKIFLTQTNIILGFLEDEIEEPDDEVPERNIILETNENLNDDELEVTENDVMDVIGFEGTFMDIVRRIKTDSLEKLKKQAGIISDNN